jgi:hypothetical protein
VARRWGAKVRRKDKRRARVRVAKVAARRRRLERRGGGVTIPSAADVHR